MLSDAPASLPPPVGHEPLSAIYHRRKTDRPETPPAGAFLEATPIGPPAGIFRDNQDLTSPKAPQVPGLPHLQRTPLWDASLWAKVFGGSVAERARLPQGAAMQGALRASRSGFPEELSG